MDTDATQKPRFADYIRPVWQRKWLILVAVIVATAGVYTYYNQQAKVYDADTLVYTKDPGDPVSGVQASQSSDRAVQNQAALLYSRDIAARVKKETGYPGTAGQLLSSVTITARSGEDFVSISARSPIPQQAADIANGYADEFVRLSKQQNQLRIAKALKVANDQLNALGKSSSNKEVRQTLGDQIRRLELALAVPSTSAQQVNPAVAPISPTSPKPLRNALFAFVLSLILACAVAFGFERFDRRIKRPEDIERAYGLPLLAVLPHSPSPTPVENGMATVHPVFRESFRSLRTNIELANLDHPAKVILVSSAIPGEGKSTVARNLAIAFRETGKRVVVVEADLRRPAMSSSFAHEPGPGLTEVLTSEATLDEVMLWVPVAVPGLETIDSMTPHPIPDTNGSSNGDPAAEHAGTVALLLSGSRPANPPAVLASEQVVRLLDQLQLQFDIVIIDSAPLLSVTDSVPLLRYADSTLLVSRLGVTSRDTSRRLVEFIARVPDARPIGVVANDLSQFEASGYGYGYGYAGRYGYGYGYGDKEQKKAQKKQAEAQQSA